ncbi:MAG: hypothetical protein KF729_20295 [Sandaracinaceae bacterium]|nr:hypothetical protein [Sandaracinaceae bacterium]
MASPRERLLDAIEAWQRERALERVARWRRDPNALDEAAVARRHARLRGPRARELFEECVERGSLDDGERRAVVEALRAAHLAEARAAGEARVRAALAAPVAFDSDFHAGGALLERLGVHPDGRARRAMMRALEPLFLALSNARAERDARVAEAAETAAWLPAAPTEDAALDADALLAATDGAWQELLARVAHAARVPTDDIADLLHALRAPAWDDLVPRRTRPRRVLATLGDLSFGDALARGARAEPSGDTLRAAVVVVEPSRDVRLAAGVELGLASERDYAAALVRAGAHLTQHPALAAVTRRSAEESIPRALGALAAHLYADPRFVARAFPSLSAKERRAAGEHCLAVELFELRTDAAAHLARPHAERRAFPEVARELLRRALGVDASASFAAVLAGDERARDRLDAARHAGPLAVALRERYDEDFFRNPRAAEPLRHAASRGATLGARAWADELGATPDALPSRLAELLA